MTEIAICLICFWGSVALFKNVIFENEQKHARRRSQPESDAIPYRVGGQSYE